MGSPFSPRPSRGAEIAAGSAAQRILLSPQGRLVWVFAAVAAFAALVIGDSWLLVAVIVVTLTVFVAMAAPDIVAAFGWQPATLEIDRVPAILGSSPAATYRRRSRKARDVSDAVVSCRMMCEERVVYEQGSDTRTDIANVFAQTFTARGVGTADGLEASVQLDIPAWTGAPTFDLGKNSVRWYVIVSVEGPGLPSDEQHFPIVVAPQLAPDVRNQVGDR